MALDIALPFYGDVAFMKQSVQSVLNQTDPNWRLVVVDDGYPDESIPDWFANLNDPRIKYSRNEFNLGANRNFQKCLGLLSEEFCLIMGADDLLENNFVEVIHSTIAKFPDAVMIHPGVKVIDEYNDVIFTRSDKVKANIRRMHENNKVLVGEALAKSLMDGNWMYFPSIVWRTRKIQEIGFRSEFDVCQDLGLAMDLIMQGGNLVLIENVIFRYRRHTGSDSSIKALTGERFLDEKRFFNVMAADLKEIGWNKASRRAKVHLTSRLHALRLIPVALRRAKSPLSLIKHTFL